MGKKLDLSRLTDEEAQHVWEVVRRDLELRRKEEERLRGHPALRSLTPAAYSHAVASSYQPAAPASPPGLSGPLLSCWSRVGLLYLQLAASGGVTLLDQCGVLLPPFLLPSMKKETYVLKRGSPISRPRIGPGPEPVRIQATQQERFGSAKVIRSLCERLPSGGGPQPGPGEESGDTEQTDTDGELDTAAQARPLGSRSVSAEKKRLLLVHSLDFDADSDDSSPPGSHPPSLQGLAGEPAAEEAGARAAGRHPHAEERTDGGVPAGRAALNELHPTGQPCAVALGVAATPDSACARRSRLPAASQGPLLSKALAVTLLSFALLRAGLPTQGPRRRDDRAYHPPNGTEAPCHPRAPRPLVKQAGLQVRWEKSPPGPRDPVQPSRTADEELSALEDRVAVTASEVQQAESEVSDIESRIEALRAAGLTVQPAGRARRCGAGGSLDPKSMYRRSLTQRNPSSRRGATQHSFAKPVMTHKP
ncbi:melanophilin [Pteropus vampyrus]|uniref:Melanophilin n=1 Tax=Pteropus vampyrus TaxID=132908 RepID=A0A6P3RT34_PTEVA|nr:melanophilin [Pteropus vampyrus]